MSSSTHDPRGPYFESAFDILATEGYGNLKLAVLCERVGVTTGAFYHNFLNWRDFTRQFLAHWHQERTAQLAELARFESGPLDRLEFLVSAASRLLPHRAEAAIRVWSSIDPAVAALQESVDRERLAVAREAFLDLLGDEAEAERFAQLGLFLLVGFEQSGGSRDPETLAWSLHLIKQVAVDRAISSLKGARSPDSGHGRR